MKVFNNCKSLNERNVLQAAETWETTENNRRKFKKQNSPCIKNISNAQKNKEYEIKMYKK